MVKFDDRPFPFQGTVTWLTVEQGGRRAAPPPVSSNADYAQTAFVLPHNADTGLASFVLRGFEDGALTSTAEGRWLLVENAGDQHIRPGSVVVILEGSQPAARFEVETVDPMWKPFD